MSYYDIEKLHKRISKIQQDNDDDYIIYKKIKNLKYNDKMIGHEKALRIIYEWLDENAIYHIENDAFNGHKWREAYLERYEKLVHKINKIENNSKSKNTSKSKSTSKVKDTNKNTSKVKNTSKSKK